MEFLKIIFAGINDIHFFIVYGFGIVSGGGKPRPYNNNYFEPLPRRAFGTPPLRLRRGINDIRGILKNCFCNRN
jgi:hypothetical protein